ncbi:hypothetical protein [Cohnella algarum]|uniref:hypothetical protein n=1 Tax=Cohnella algarum TaxID=2044859 RepID=UPI0019676A3E|nr:hypothetical protein [Cohnella algarum]MBN2980136.1 hypothetical protein [Cohnella algarum]
MEIRIEIAHSDGKDRLRLFDPTEDVQKYTVAAFFGYCREMNGPGPLQAGQRMEPERPEWYETGIKYKNGVAYYRTRYWCQNPGCKHQGNQYIKLTDTTTECHECGNVLQVRPAAGIVGSDGVPEQDRFGNFFRADKPAEGGV